MSETGKPAKTKVRTIEALAEAEKVSPSVLAGVSVIEAWSPGKVVSPGDFRKAVGRFLGQPANGGAK